jgi:hypothetical protein
MLYLHVQVRDCPKTRIDHPFKNLKALYAKYRELLAKSDVIGAWVYTDDTFSFTIT